MTAPRSKPAQPTLSAFGGVRGGSDFEHVSSSAARRDPRIVARG